MPDRDYLCIDLKSFYASVECADRGLDPFVENLVVADSSRGDGAICLAVSPALKQLGVKNRCRLFDIPSSVKYTAVKPRMKLYMEVSARIYSIYLRYVSEEDIHVYSIDECFIDITPYRSLYKKSPREMAQTLINEIYSETGITATAGIGTNMFLAKVALDVTAKHSPDNIGCLDEKSFKEKLWYHRPITDIWGIGRGIAKRLERLGAYCLHDITQISENVLYKEFGVNAEFLIDHAHGRETCTIADIRNHSAKSSSMSHGQILFEDYTYDNALLIMKEMVNKLVLEMTEKGKVTDSISLFVKYSKDSIPPSGASHKLSGFTGSYRKICNEFEKCYRECVLKNAPIRAVNIALGNISDENCAVTDLFSDTEAEQREQRMQKAILAVQSRYGKNSLLRAMSYQEQSTARQRNKLIGGHNGE